MFKVCNLSLFVPQVESLIAYGAFGEVLKVRRRKDNLVYAMKVNSLLQYCMK